MSVSKLFLATGAATLAGALLWWWATYGDVIQYRYLSLGEAGRCLVGDSDICALAKALCLGSHPRAVSAYWTSAFWLGLGVLSLGLLTPTRRKRAPETHVSIVPSEELTSP